MLYKNGRNKMKFILFVILALTFTSSANAGPFRDGKVFPLIRNRVIINDRNPTPATPNPPPIITVAPPVPQPEQTKSPTPEDIKLIQELLSPTQSDSDSPSSKYPPFMPIGGVAGGGLVMLLALLRKSLTSH